MRFLARSHRPLRWLSAGCVAGLTAGTIVATAGATDDRATPTPAAATAPATWTPSPAPSATTVTRAAEATPTPTPVPESGVGKRVQADPVRVKTDDGSCLNVRPAPGSTFQAQAYTCLPDGSLLWLYGPERTVDGQAWRLALGAGWVATKFTRLAQAPAVRTPEGASVTVWGRDFRTGGLDVASVDLASGRVRSVALPADLKSGRNPVISEDGRFVALGEGRVFIVRLDNGGTKEIPDATAWAWNASNRLLLWFTDGRVGYYEAETGEVVTLAPAGSKIDAPPFWDERGKGVYICISGKLFRFALDGTKTEIAVSLPEGVGLWAPKISPDGTRLLVGSFNGLWVVDLRGGATSEFRRAPQLQNQGGKCGGGFSVVDGWLDADRVFYHERSSSTREDGITIGDLRTGDRRVYPYFNVMDMTRVGPDLLVFSTYNNVDEVQLAVTFVLDLRTGEAAPLYLGSGAVWTK